LVQTVDYFTPIVDDPYQFGQIAAANSLSDIYAMGARPLFALNLVGFPASLPLDILTDILCGGADKAREAGIAIVGGHTIDDPEPKYGLVVTGVVEPDRVYTNAAAQVGDVLFLTKPLGIGIISTAIKRDLASPDLIQRAVEVMATLNAAAAEAMATVGAHACTDVTGFGLLGHLHEMTAGSGVGAVVRLSQVPVLPEVWALAEQGVVPGGTRRNREFLEKEVLWDEALTPAQQIVLCDAQTSGGLLIAVPPERAATLREALRAAGTLAAAEIGTIVDDPTSRIQVQP
jgi:selenide,water dikinase